MSNPEHKGFEPLLSDEVEPAIEYFGLDKKLNRRQRVFVWTVVNNPQMSYVEAARKSGYKDARQSAYKLLHHPEVKKEIQYLMGEVRKKVVCLLMLRLKNLSRILSCFYRYQSKT